MTPTEKYTYIIEQLAQLLKDRDDTISLQRWKIATLEEELSKAEATISGGKVS